MLLAVYSGARALAGGDVGGAYRSATQLVGLEHRLHLPAEQHLQAAVLAWRPLTRAANAYYAYAHLPVTALALAWLFLRHREPYGWARRALVTTTAAALAVYVLLPVAPPRLLPGLGFVDTGRLLGQSVYGEDASSTLTDQYAAMPSLHVGWSLLVAVVGAAAAATSWRWLWLLHPLVTVVVVVSTGNHYWLDAVVGAALVGSALLLTRRPAAGLLRSAQPPALAGGCPPRTAAALIARHR